MISLHFIQEKPHPVLNDELHHLKKDRFLVTILKSLSIRLVNQLRIGDPGNRDSSDELRLIELITSRGKCPSIEAQPIIVVIAVWKDSIAVTEQHNAAPLFEKAQQVLPVSDGVNAFHQAAVIPVEFK